MTSLSSANVAQGAHDVAATLAVAIAHARQGQTAQALASLTGTINSAEQRQALCRALIDRPDPSLGRAIALHRAPPRGERARDSHQEALCRLLRRSLAVQASPNQSLAARAADLNRHGEGLFKAGRYKRAAECFQRAFELAPNNAGSCLNLAEAVARAPVKKGEVSETEALGRAIAETGKWDVAVRHYRRALKLDPAKVQEHQQAQRFKIDPAHQGQIDNPIFIVGCGHSGTSLMLAMLGAHPRIHPIPKESALFLRTDAQINQTLREWDAETNTEGKARWAEKTPPHIFQIHRFLAFRPKARFILMLRDGRDVVCSLRYRTGYENIQDRIDRWVYDNLAAQSYWDHPQLKIVKYEDLIRDTEATLRDLCQFLGEDYSPQLLDYHKTEHRWYSDTIEKPEAINTIQDHNANRNWQINQPIFDGRGRWLAEMTEAEKAQFKNSPAQTLLEQFGYVADHNG